MFDPKQLAELAVTGKEEPAEEPTTAPTPVTASASMHAMASDMIQAFKAGSASELASCLTNLRALMQAPDED